MDEHEKRKDCEQEFARIWTRLDKGDRTFDELKGNDKTQDIDINVLKTQMSTLVTSISGLTKALWGIVLTVAVGGVGFVIWYVQTK
jgi:nitrate reductase NapE component